MTNNALSDEIRITVEDLLDEFSLDLAELLESAKDTAMVFHIGGRVESLRREIGNAINGKRRRDDEYRK